MRKHVVIFIAPPGAGKGTQADLLAERFGWFHLETAKIIEEKFARAKPGDAEIEVEKENFLSGKLVDPIKVTGWVVEKIRELAARSASIVFSGSFRSLYEAQVELAVVEELYGKDCIAIFFIQVSEDESVRRNSARRICEANRHPIPNLPEYDGIVMCPQDGSLLVKRELDTPDVIRRRYREYQERTKPALDYMRQQKYEIIEINGERGIEHVSRDIASYFHDNS